MNTAQMMGTPWDSFAEQLLAAVAIKVELPPSQYLLLAERREAVEKHLERVGSPLKGQVRCYYPQGSVAIGATIRPRYRQEGFDLDIVAELIPHNLSPRSALNLLFEAIRGDSGSTYFSMTERQSRCVTVRYADGTHIDFTPSELINASDPRRSNIFHSKLEESEILDRKILTNSFGFAEEYNDRCPVDAEFQKEYARRALAADRGLLDRQMNADSLPVPNHSTVAGGKSAVTVALQLIKRNRNIRWANRDGRMPASVMLSCLALGVAEGGRTIGENLQIIAQHILDRLLEAKNAGALIHVENPRCRGDIFTDRWPESKIAQDTMINDMKLFMWQLGALLDQKRSIKERVNALKAMFGESIGQTVIDEYSNKLGTAIQSAKHNFGIGGGIVAAPAAAANPVVKPTTFYGDSRCPNQ